jgi:hypothetical protein
MTSQHDKPKRWRPRFSVRTLVIIVTLVCLYAASWGPTKTRGTQEVLHREDTSLTARAIAPLLISIDEEHVSHDVFADGSCQFWTEGHRSYYFWFFGYVAELPYEREI